MEQILSIGLWKREERKKNVFSEGQECLADGAADQLQIGHEIQSTEAPTCSYARAPHLDKNETICSQTDS